MSGLITDLDLLSGKVTSPIDLRDGTLLTPAARDRAVARGFVIIERDGSGGAPDTGAGKPRCACSASAGTGNAPTAAGLLADGLHLVRVQAGQLLWSRPVSAESPERPPVRPSA